MTTLADLLAIIIGFGLGLLFAGLYAQALLALALKDRLWLFLIGTLTGPLALILGYVTQPLPGSPWELGFKFTGLFRFQRPTA